MIASNGKRALHGQPITAKEVTRSLMGYVRLNSSSSIVMPNVFVDKSPWESDVIRVTVARFWTEYEIKVSLSDFCADFHKREYRWSASSRNKHDSYASKHAIEVRTQYGNRKNKVIPKPKQFYFVVPKGMLNDTDIPAHCGVMEFDRNDRSSWGIRVSKRAPNLKAATKLEDDAIFNLAMKAAYRLALPIEQPQTIER